MPDTSSNTTRNKKSVLKVRTATLDDVPRIARLSQRAFGDDLASSAGMIQGQIANFPDGQFVVEYDGEIVGYAASFRIDEATAMRQHTWNEISGGGYASRHDPKGEWLYGMEVAVDPDRRRLRIGQRLYDTRVRLCENEELKGIVFGGRMPGWARKKKQYPDPKDYLQAVVEKGGSAEEIEKVLGEAGLSGPALETQTKLVASPWFREFMTMDPKPALEKTRCPVLVLGGDLDLQVVAEQNVPAIEAALKAGGNARVDTQVFEGLNHMLQPAKTGTPDEYGQIETTIDEKALAKLESWVVAQTKR